MQFSNNWFEQSELRRYVHQFLGVPETVKVLEIGTFEGAFACHVSNTYDNVQLTCVDPFSTADTTSNVYDNLKQRFLANIKQTKNWHKVTLVAEPSLSFFKKNRVVFDFIYVDGDHTYEGAKLDFVNCITICRVGGIIWFDDYMLECSGEHTVKKAVDEVYNNNKHCLELIHCAYQIAFKKTREE